MRWQTRPPHFGGRYWLFVKLITDQGVVGWGEAYYLPMRPSATQHLIEDICARQVVGADPFKIERLWRVIYSAGYAQRPGLVCPARCRAHPDCVDPGCHRRGSSAR